MFHGLIGHCKNCYGSYRRSTSGGNTLNGGTLNDTLAHLEVLQQQTETHLHTFNQFNTDVDKFFLITSTVVLGTHSLSMVAMTYANLSNGFLTARILPILETGIYLTWDQYMFLVKNIIETTIGRSGQQILWVLISPQYRWWSIYGNNKLFCH